MVIIPISSDSLNPNKGVPHLMENVVKGLPIPIGGFLF